MPTRVLLADDHPVYREGLAGLIDVCDDMVVVGQASDGAAALALAEETRPDVAVLDLNMPGLHGIEAKAAVLAQLTDEVYAVERIGPLLAKAKANMRTIQQFKVRLKHADGQWGLPEAAPFDTIILAAAAAHVPQALLQQLALGGRMLMPLGAAEQHLLLVERRAEGFVETRLDGVRFVPLLSGVE